MTRSQPRNRRRLLFGAGLVLALLSTGGMIATTNDSMPHPALLAGFVAGLALVVLGRIGEETDRSTGRLLGGARPDEEDDGDDSDPLGQFLP